MYKIPKMKKTSIAVNTSDVGERLENKLERVIHNQEPIDNSVGMRAYNERKDGVIASRNMRTDRFEIAAESMAKAAKIKNEGYTKRAKERIEAEQKARENAEKIVKDESIRGDKND